LTSFALRFTLAFLVVVPLFAQQPFITDQSVVNAASLGREQVRRLAPGSIASIFGGALATETLVASVPLRESLGGTRVTFDGYPAKLYFVSPTQINLMVPVAVLPPGTTAKRVAVVVHTPRGESPAAIVDVTPTAVGVFTQNASGSGPAVAVNTNPDGSISLNTAETPVRPGGYLTIYATGLGATSPPLPEEGIAPFDPLAVAQTRPVVLLDVVTVPVLYAGRAPGFAGLDQINVQVPVQLGDACNASLIIVTGSASQTSVSQTVQVFVRNQGSCP
jgi:uncharacterized protein (TIGR03437 family)